ncbi:MAG: PAS domain S-box protein [Calditrichaeota bacterium]|nr:MAG: PAS domain S-box protein [Calditrichota bacterium]MBL1207614.1 PAS domain S-box protein [Calditrichota bacterium]NOG47447.1 PAS domain S-box protein [Calditrichota bacterium]
MTNYSENKTLKNNRLFFIVTFLILIAIYYLVKDVRWQGNKEFHTTLEIIATILAFGAGLLALVRFYTKKSNAYLLIGAAFIGTAFLDGFHALITSNYFEQMRSTSLDRLIPWSWNVSRVFLSITMYGSYLVWKVENRYNINWRAKQYSVLVYCFLFIVFSFLLILFFPLPRAYYKEFVFGRPEEYVSAFFFLLALHGYYKKGEWKTSSFEFWIVLSLIIGFLGQALFMPFSSAMFDIQFDAAHIIKKVSYLFVHIGLLTSFYYLFRNSEKQKIQILTEIKERELAEKNMAKYRKRNELILYSAIEGIIGLDIEGRHTFVNPAAQQILGYSEDEMIGNDSHSMWHHSKENKTNFPVSECPIHISMKEKIAFSEDNAVFWHKNGLPVFVQYSVSPLKQGEKIIGSMIVFQDVTKIRRSEAQLHRLSQVVEQSPTIIVITDTMGKIEYVNPAFTKATGYTADEVLGENPRILNSGKNKTDIKNLWETLNANKTWEGEFYNKRKSGEMYWEAAIVSPLKNVDGATTHFVAIKTDISRQKELQDKLWHSENLIRMILDQIPQRIFWKDKEYKYLGANKLFASDAGFSSGGELIGRDDFEMPWKEIAHKHREDDKTILEGGEIKINFEEPVFSEDGIQQWIRTSKQPLLDQDGNIFGVLGNFEDITERKKAEQSLREYAHDLEKSNKELEEFAYIASHDLQEPLRKVTTFGDRLKEKYSDELPQNARDYLNRMNDAASRMRVLINDLLNFSRVTSKAKEFEQLDLSQTVKDVITNLEVKIEKENAIINVEKLHDIEADQSQVYRLFQNIISNSLKYRKPDINPEIKVHCKIADRNGQNNGDQVFEPYCHIYVEDNGIGFDEKYIDKVFAPFQRLHGRHEYEGTGMGLAICSKIVTRHRGFLTAKSTPGKGSVFIVCLPVKQRKKDGRK